LLARFANKLIKYENLKQDSRNGTANIKITQNPGAKTMSG